MSFRTIEITGPAELHVKDGSLIVEKEKSILGCCFANPEEYAQNSKNTNPRQKKQKPKTSKKPETVKISIPLEDIRTIICMGANLRISTMAMAKLCENKITVMMLDEKYHPAGILTAYESNARQSLVMRKQACMDKTRANVLWKQIISKKIQNQARALQILALDGTDRVLSYVDKLDHPIETEIDPVEAGAAKTYFEYLLPGANRRDETPENSRLNYGYAIIRNSITRAVIAAGFLPSFGIHHQNLFNAFNLSDDLIEPFRPCVDLIAAQMNGTELQLNRNERRQLAEVLQHAVQIEGKKMSVLQAIDHMVISIRNYMMDDADTVELPAILPVEVIHHIKE